MELYFIRHGETAWSLTGQHTGRSEVPLTANGEQEARELGERLRHVTFDQVFVSPRLRARRTCELAGWTNATVEPDLAEWDYGDYEGQRSDEIHAKRPGWDIYTDGCPGGESPAQLVARADRMIARWRTLAGRVAAFSHGHFGRVLGARWIGLPVTQARHFVIGTASYSVLAREPDRGDRPVIAQWNILPDRVS